MLGNFQIDTSPLSKLSYPSTDFSPLIHHLHTKRHAPSSTPAETDTPYISSFQQYKHSLHSSPSDPSSLPLLITQLRAQASLHSMRLKFDRTIALPTKSIGVCSHPETVHRSTRMEQILNHLYQQKMKLHKKNEIAHFSEQMIQDNIIQQKAAVMHDINVLQNDRRRSEKKE